jgi:hypothetical protein
MASTRDYHRSFSGGEISPNMYGRIDDNRYSTGAAYLRNFIALPQGPAQNRTGTVFVRETKGSVRARLIPFTYSMSQTMVIELGVNYIRFHTSALTLLNTAATPILVGGNSLVGNMYTFAGNTYYCKTTLTPVVAAPNADPTNWYLQTSTVFEIPTTFTATELFDVHYVQSGDIITLVHPAHKPAELRRYSSSRWAYSNVSFSPSVSPPAAPSIAATRGEQLTIASMAAGPPLTFTITTGTTHQFAIGDSVYVSGCLVSSGATFPDGFYVINTIGAGTFSLKTYDAGAVVTFANVANYTGSSGSVQFGSRISDINNYYVVTSVSTGGTESAASVPVNVINNLYINGAYNTISWGTTGAQRYNVYKRQSGLYGYIGQTDGLAFTDNNIAPDMGITPPIYDTVFSSTGNYPGAVSYYEQRRVFAGTDNDPQYLWLTRSGTESDMSYSIPTTDIDRVAIRVSARESNTIRHVVPLTQLLLLTNAAEWRVSPSSSDVITPTTISVRPQSYVGANTVQPQIVNNTVVYCSSRGGHVRELGYSWQSQGFITGDLSLRAAHLFDNLDIVDMCFAKSPQQILWFVSSNGKLLGLSYVPEEEIGAWHQHDTDGTFESCCAVAEGFEDAVYVVVCREVNGSTVRYVERFGSRANSILNLVFTDSSLKYNGSLVTGTMTLSGGTTWGPSDTLTLTASLATFLFPVATDLNDAIVLSDAAGNQYRCKIIGTTSTFVAQVKVDGTIPVALRNTATSSWTFARDTFTGLNHLEGKTVSILADGAVVPQQVVVSGTVSLPRAASYITVGLPFQSDIQTLPLTMNNEGFGQGRMKNINKAWIKVEKSSGIFIGPDADHLVEYKQRTTETYGVAPTPKSEEVLVMLTPSWSNGGQIYIRQSDPLPLTVVGLTLEAAIGG